MKREGGKQKGRKARGRREKKGEERKRKGRKRKRTGGKKKEKEKRMHIPETKPPKDLGRVKVCCHEVNFLKLSLFILPSMVVSVIKFARQLLNSTGFTFANSYWVNIKNSNSFKSGTF